MRRTAFCKGFMSLTLVGLVGTGHALAETPSAQAPEKPASEASSGTQSDAPRTRRRDAGGESQSPLVSGRPVPEALSTQPSTGPLSELGATLHDAGIDINALAINYSQWNPTGGVVSGQTGNSAIVFAGVDFNLGKLVGLTGGTIHAEEAIFGLKYNAVVDYGSNPLATYRGHYFSQDVGSVLGGVAFPNNIPTHYLSRLSYEQKFGNLEVELGRMNPLRAFNQPNCDNVLSCQDPVMQYNTAITPPAFATWAARAKYNINDNWWVQAGAYESNFAVTQTEGYDWGMGDATGAFLISELGYNSSFAQTSLPGYYEIGTYYDTSTFTNSWTGEEYQGSGGIFFRGHQTVWSAPTSNSKGPPPSYVNIFGTLDYSLTSQAPYRFYGEIGANWFGFIEGRPFDSIGAKFAYINITKDQLLYQNQFRISWGGEDSLSSPNQYRLELNGHIQLEHGIAIEPSVQYIINPDSFFGTPFVAERAPRDGWIVSAVLIVPISNMLGLSAPR